MERTRAGAGGELREEGAAETKGYELTVTPIPLHRLGEGGRRVRSAVGEVHLPQAKSVLPVMVVSDLHIRTASYQLYNLHFSPCPAKKGE